MGCVANGCLVLNVLLLLFVGYVVTSIWLKDRQAEEQAEDEVTAAVQQTRRLLSREAEDGSLLGTEIQRAVVSQQRQVKVRSEVRRDGRRVTVTVYYTGFAGGWFGPSGDDSGCYRFAVVPAAALPPVSVRELPEEECGFRTEPRRRRPSADVVEDVTAELRTAVAEGGPEAAAEDDVWRTDGVRIETTEIRDGQLTVLAWLFGEDGIRSKYCYEFRASDKPVTVTAKTLDEAGCYRIEPRAGRQG